MKNIIIFIALLISFDSFSQSFLNARLAVDYSFLFNHTSLNESILSDLHDINNLKRDLIEWFDNEISINYRTSRKTSIELLTGFKKYNYEVRSNYIYNLGFKEITYGLGLNYYYGKNYSPIGNSFGLFYKVCNYIVDDYNDFYAYLQRIEKDNYETSTIINHKIAVLGFKLNFVSMLSDKLPLYLKYGGTLSMPISAKIFDASYKKESFSEYIGGLHSNNFLKHFTSKERYKLYLGIGYMF